MDGWERSSIPQTPNPFAPLHNMGLEDGFEQLDSPVQQHVQAAAQQQVPRCPEVNEMRNCLARQSDWLTRHVRALNGPLKIFRRLVVAGNACYASCDSTRPKPHRPIASMYAKGILVW